MSAKTKRNNPKVGWPRKSAQHTLKVEEEKCTTYSTNGGTIIDSPIEDCDIDGIYTNVIFDSDPPVFTSPAILSLPKFALEILCKSTCLKPLALEKLLWVCDELEATGGSTKEGAPVNVTYFRARFSMRGSELIDHLLKCGIIEMCAQYCADRSSRRYRFTDQTTRPCSYKLKIPKIIKKRGDRDAFTRARLAAAKLPAKMLEDLKLFKPTAGFKAAFRICLDEMREKGSDTTTMESARAFALEGSYRFSIKQHRITNHILGFPEEIREHFTVDGKRAIELDLPNSHPSFLPIIFAPYKSLKEGDKIVDASLEDIEEHARFTDLVSSGKFYEEFEDYWEASKGVFVDYIGNGGAPANFLANTPRKGIKLCWQILFNGKTNPTRLFRTCLWKKFSYLVPCISARMAQYKRAKPRALGDELRRREAQMVSAIASKLKSPCITTYDGFMCAWDAEAELIELCRTETRKHLGFVHLPISKKTPVPECVAKKEDWRGWEDLVGRTLHSEPKDGDIIRHPMTGMQIEWDASEVA